MVYGCVTSVEAGREDEVVNIGGLRLCGLCRGWWGGRRSQWWSSGRPKMEVVTYGCVTSVEAGGEATGVNDGGLGGLRCEAPTHSSVTSMEAGGEAAGVNVGGLAGLRWRLLPTAV